MPTIEELKQNTTAKFTKQNPSDRITGAEARQGILPYADELLNRGFKIIDNVSMLSGYSGTNFKQLGVVGVGSFRFIENRPNPLPTNTYAAFGSTGAWQLVIPVGQGVSDGNKQEITKAGEVWTINDNVVDANNLKITGTGTLVAIINDELVLIDLPNLEKSIPTEILPDKTFEERTWLYNYENKNPIYNIPFSSSVKEYYISVLPNAQSVTININNLLEGQSGVLAINFGGSSDVDMNSNGVVIGTLSKAFGVSQRFQFLKNNGSITLQ